MGLAIIIAFSNQLATQFNMSAYFTVVLIFLQGISAITRLFNARFSIVIRHEDRMFVNTVIMLFSYFLLGASIFNLEKIEGFYICVVACFFHGFS